MAGKRRVGPGVNVKRKKFIKNLVDGVGIGESALRAGYSDVTAGSHLLQQSAVLTALQAAMCKAGIDDEYLTSKIKEGLDATYPEKRFKGGGVMTPAAPDFFTRNLYLDKALKVRGDYAPEKHIEQKQILQIIVTDERTRGLIDCGVIDALDVTELKGENDGRRNEADTRGFLERGKAEGEGCENRGEPEAVRQETEHPGQNHDSGGLSEADQRREGPGEAPDAQGSPPGSNVPIGR
jgi:hypothetical protein